MNRLTTLGMLLVVLLATACKDNTKFILEGTIANAPTGEKAFLYGFKNNEMVVIDSTTLSDKGAFKFERTSPDADIFRLALNNKSYMVIAGNGDEIELKADFTDQAGGYTLDGTKNAEDLQTLNTLRNKYSTRLNAIQADFDAKVEAAPAEREKHMQALLPVYNGALKEMNDAVVAFANEHYTSIVSFYAMTMLNPQDNEAAMVAYADKIRGRFANNLLVASFVTRMEGLKRIQVGQTAPDFESTTLDGKPVKLSDFRGKYVLLDFWASWCQPCREENPNIVKAYNAYKDKNFTVFGLSIDKDKNAWKQAVVQDGLTWTQAGDGNDFNSKTAMLYQIESIPSSFLLDPQGKIIARNLRGAELEVFLAKTLK